MSKKEELLDHEYDGIKELDNPLPRWWLMTFYGAILFSIPYVFYYHFGSGPTPMEELAAEMRALEAKKPVGHSAGPEESALLALFQDPAKRQEGSVVYQKNCAACHGAAGEGSIGPNLTDAYWIHGDGKLLALHQVISEGVPAKGMPPWKALLKKEEMQTVVAYVHSLLGTKPANAKAPEGSEVK